jgi:C1A family cysteine protease
MKHPTALCVAVAVLAGSCAGVFVRPAGAPAMFDWRVHGAVTPVNDQGQCGSSVAIALAEVAEGANFVENRVLQPLSIPQIKNCAAGCLGSTITGTINWFLNNYGGEIATAESYGTASTTCASNTSRTGATLRARVNIETKNEARMMSALIKMGPIAVLMDASSLQSYTTGVEKCLHQNPANDALVIVGYNTETPVPYWIVKNSWGKDWGEGGYVMLRLGHNDCGIATAPWTVSVLRC